MTACSVRSLRHRISMPFLAVALATSGAMTLVASPAWAAAGQFDPTFGVGGLQTVVENAPTYAFPDDVAIQSDNKIIAIGMGNGSFMWRLTPGGVPDSTFGTGGRSPTVGNPSGVAIQSDGKILVAGRGAQFNVGRYRTDGTPDASFGVNGFAHVSFPGFPDDSTGATALLIQPDGKIVVTGHVGVSYAAMPFSSFEAVVRLLPDGSLDTGFGEGGRVVTGYPSGYVYPYGLARQADGKLIVVGTNFSDATDTRQDWVTRRYTADGALDASFSGGTVVTTFLEAVGFARRVVVQPDGRILVVGSGGEGSALLRLETNGARDAGFGNGGLVNPVRATAYDAYSLALQPDGKIIVGVSLLGGSVTAVRLLANGLPDDSYAPPVFKVGTAYTQMFSAVLQPDGKLLLAGAFRNATGGSDLAFARLQGDEITGVVVEFYNTTLQHYFVTASAAEQTSIDAGGSGPGWTRTGLSFKSGGNSRVCRFYGTPGVGPNSHFYTISADECGQVKRDPGWHFESYDFSASPPTGGAACAPATEPVYRAYNGRFAVNDSNHRQTTNLAQYNATLALGWIGEGVVMCAPI